MQIIIFSVIGLVSFMAIVVMVAWQVFALRQGKVTVTASGSLGAALQPQVDHVAFHISAFSASMLKHAYIKILEWLRVLLLISKLLITRVEKRFARIINTVKGKGVVTKRGSVSLFLKEVEQYKLEVKSLEEGK